MECTQCGAEAKGAFCPKCGTATEDNSHGASVTRNLPVTRKPWFLPTISGIATLLIVGVFLIMGVRASNAYADAQQSIASAQASLKTAQEAQKTADGRLAALIACNDYFKSDCSLAAGGTLTQFRAAVAEKKAAVDAASAKVTDITNSTQSSKSLVDVANIGMLAAGIVGGLATIGLSVVAYSRRGKERDDV